MNFRIYKFFLLIVNDGFQNQIFAFQTFSSIQPSSPHLFSDSSYQHHTWHYFTLAQNINTATNCWYFSPRISQPHDAVWGDCFSCHIPRLRCISLHDMGGPQHHHGHISHQHHQSLGHHHHHHHQYVFSIDHRLHRRIGVFSMPSISASLQWPQLASAIWLQVYQEQVIMSNDYILHVKQSKGNLINRQAFDKRMSSFKM